MKTCFLLTLFTMNGAWTPILLLGEVVSHTTVYKGEGGEEEET